MIEPKRPMIRLFRYLGNYKGSVWLAVSSSILNKVLDLMPPFLTAWLIDTVSGNTPEWIVKLTGSNDLWSSAIFIAILIVVIFGLESFFQWLYKRGFMRLAQRVQNDLRIFTYRRMQSREIAFFEEQRTGNLMSILNNDINQLERFLNDSFNEIIQMFTLIIVAGWALLNVSPDLGLISFFPIPLIVLGSLYYQRNIAPFYKEVRETVGELSNRLENNISGINVIKSFTSERFETERVQAASEKYRNANFKAIRWSSLYVPIIRMFIALGLATTLLIGSYQILNGIGTLTLGGLAFLAMMIERLLWPVTRLGFILDEYERARASSRRVFGLIDTPNTIRNVEKPVHLNEIIGNINLESLSFFYKTGQPILNNVTLEITAGQTIGIAGPTGAGKTTLIKLLLRFYDVTGGSIKIDGIDIRELDIHQLRRNIALVSQDVYLFHGSIFENIAYGMDNRSVEEVSEAAKKAKLHDFIASLPDGYDSIIGERGIKLSGGQRQRLSIARAILKNAPILILDEATSSVDTETERAIQQSLEEMTRGKTAIVIAHRLSTIRRADAIIVLKDGEIVEKGNHESLLSQKGIYSDLWGVQIGALG